MTAMAFVVSWQGLAICRTLLGVFEGKLFFVLSSPDSAGVKTVSFWVPLCLTWAFASHFADDF